MRKFTYETPYGFTEKKTEKEVLANAESGLYAGRRLFELVSREVVTVQKKEIK
jgi:hypothetical protein